MLSDSDRSKLYDHASLIQKSAAVISLISALTALILIVIWMNGTSASDAYLGGLNFNELLFNFHPIFMTAGMLFCGLAAIFTYRLIDLPKSVTKPLHGAIHVLALLFIILGLYAVFEGNNNREKNTGHAYYANLCSIHSFIGLGAIGVYCSNYLLGFMYFLTSLFPADSKRWYLPNHTFLGIFSLVLVFIAIETGKRGAYRITFSSKYAFHCCRHHGPRARAWCMRVCRE
jgi:hypothetical protein